MTPPQPQRSPLSVSSFPYLVSHPATVVRFLLDATPGGPILYPLAAIALILQELDLFTGVRMIREYGLGLEQNPFARALYVHGGALTLEVVKLGAIFAIVTLLFRAALRGRVRLARNTLAFMAIVGLLGVASNWV